MIKILFLAANPLDTDRLRLDEEFRAIDEALRKSAFRDHFDLLSHWAVRVDDLQELLLRHQPDIVHFSGHGQSTGAGPRATQSAATADEPERHFLLTQASGASASQATGQIVLQNAAGQRMPVPANALSGLFRVLKANIRCVVLNACYTQRQAEGIAQHIDCVVGMSSAIPDNSAIAFATAFYRGLGYGRSVQVAFDLGRSQIDLSALRGQAIPQLLAPQADPAQIHLVTDGSAPGSAVGDLAGSTAREEELVYLNALVAQYEYWAQKYTPLAGIAEVRAATATGPRLDLPQLFMPPGFEKLIEHGFGEQRQVERVPVEDLRAAVTQYRRLVLLGEPGAGKTTTLWRLVYDYAQAALQDETAPLPLLVPLGGYTGAETPLHYCQQHFGKLGKQLATYLRDNRVILLLDALNEMPRQDYRERVQRIERLLRAYPDLSVVVTCRALDYVEALALEKLDIKPLDVTRQREYLHHYLGEQHGEALFWQLTGDEVAELWTVWQAAGGTWQQFWRAEKMPDAVYKRTSAQQDKRWESLRAGELPPLLALGRNPFMLVMLAQVYAGEGLIPQNRGRLFAAFAETLLAREEQRCEPDRWLGVDVLYHTLGTLAYAMQELGERGTAVDAAWARQQIVDVVPDHRAVLYLAASATLLELNSNTVRFAHQLLQEYFAAWMLHQRWQAGVALSTFWPQGWLEPSGWEETFVLLAGMVPEMTPLITNLLSAHPLLAARCIAESGGMPPAAQAIVQVQRTLINLATHEDVPTKERNAAANALNHVGDSRPGVGLTAAGLPDIVWCSVPSGIFLMGNTKQTDAMAYGNEVPQHELLLSAFAISMYPITNVQYMVFVHDGGYTEQWRDCWTEAGWQWRSDENIIGPTKYGSAYDLPNHPVVGVSWYEAMAFCKWLGMKLGRLVMLPSEAQWEKAARGTDGRCYPWGLDLTSEHANYDATDIDTTSSVGIFPKGESLYHPLDMVGNVWEWTSSTFKAYPYKADNGREDPVTVGYRVVRGGSFVDLLHYVRCACRINFGPDNRSNRVGFRVVSPGS